ncbi:MAG TPA: YncE family protein [Thermoplasmata archaeon]|nr:YncE family protein [Thermoplasmata archaeon]
MQRFRSAAVIVLLALTLVLTLPPSTQLGGAPHAVASPVALPSSSSGPVAPAFAASPASGAPYVGSTIDLRNQTLRAGNFVPGDGLYPSWICYDPAQKLLYVANSLTNYVTIVDAVRHTIVSYLPVGTDGTDLCQVAGGNIYFAGANLHLVQVFNMTTQALVANVTLPGRGVISFGYNDARNVVYISVITRPWNVTVVSNVNYTILASQMVRNAPAATVCDPVDNEIFIGDDSDNANVLNATTLAYVTNITIGLSPQDGIWDPLNDRVFMGAQVPNNTDDLDEIDPVNNTVVASLSLSAWPNETTIDPTGQWLYFAMDPGNNVTMVNATNLTQHYTFPIGTAPNGITFDAVTGEVVTANSATDNLTFINGTSGRVDYTVADGISPAGLAYDPTTSDLLVTNSPGNVAYVWNVSQGTMAGTVSLSGAPTQARYDPTLGTVFVLRPYAGLLSEVDPATLAIQRSWNVGDGATSFAIDAAAGQVFVSNTSNYSIEALRLSDGSAVRTLTEAAPTALQYCPRTGLVYAIVGTLDDQVIAIDPANGSIVATAGIGLIGEGIECDPFNGDIYVTEQRTFNASALNGTTLDPVASFVDGGGGSGLAYDTLNAELLEVTDNPPQVQLAYIPGNATLVGTVNTSLVANLAIGVDPRAAAFDAADDSFFVANYGSGTISVVLPNTPPPRIASAALAPSPLYFPVNTSFNVTATTTSDFGIPCPAGGTYSWKVNPSDLATPAGTNSSVEAFRTSGTTGTGVVQLNATFGGTWAVVSAPLAVTGGSTIPLASAAISPTSSSLLVGRSQDFAASALLEGGAPAPASTVYAWSLVPISLGTLNATSGRDVNFTASSAGSGTLSLSVYYGGSYAFASSAITAAAVAPEVVARLVLTPSTAQVTFRSSLTFSAVALDASGNNVSSLATYHWQLTAPSLGSLAYSPGYRQAYTAGNVTGTDTLSVRASLNGATAWSNATIQVAAPPANVSKGPGTGSSFLAGVPLWAWAGLVAFIAVVVVAALVLRHRASPPPEEPGTEPEGPYVETIGVDVSSPEEETPPD